MRRMMRAGAGTAVAAVILGGAFAPAGAQAKTYQVKFCGDTPGHEPGPWFGQFRSDFNAGQEQRTLTNSCRGGGAIVAYGRDNGSGNPSLGADGYADIALTAPQTVTFTRANLAPALFGDVNLGGRTSPDLKVQVYGGSNLAFTQQLGQGGGFNRTTDRLDIALDDVSSLTVRAFCARSEGDPGCDLYAVDSAFIGLFGATVTANDTGNPVAINPRGTANNQLLAGNQELRVDLGDAGSGVKSAEALLGDTVVGSADFSEDCKPAQLQACPPIRGDVSLPVETGKVGNGDTKLRVRVRDFAGNEATTDVRDVTVANGGSAALKATPGLIAPEDAPDPNGVGRGASAGAQCFYRASDNKFFNPDAQSGTNLPNGNAAGGRLTASTSKRAHAYTAGATVSGRLVGAVGPIVGARVFLATRTEGGQWSLCGAQQTVTNGDGAWKAKLPGRQPNRDVLAIYWPSTSSDQGVGSSVLGVRVRSGVTLNKPARRVRGGRKVTFRGSVRGSIPRGGALALLQVRVPKAKRFRTFRQVRSGSTGRVQAKFRFARASNAKYRFRIYVPRQNGRPFDAGYSRTRIVTVR